MSLSRVRASRFARICFVAGCVSIGRAMEDAFHTGLTTEIVWSCIWLVAAAAFDYYAWRKS